MERRVRATVYSLIDWDRRLNIDRPVAGTKPKRYSSLLAAQTMPRMNPKRRRRVIRTRQADVAELADALDSGSSVR